MKRWVRQHTTSYYATRDPKEAYAEMFTQWFYDPASVPQSIVRHFGWGSGVRSLGSRLDRWRRSHVLTYQEMERGENK